MLLLRPARAEEANELSDLALAAKAHWGYDDDFLDKCRKELSYTAEDVTRPHFVVADNAGEVVGFYSIDGTVPIGHLGNLWVKPSKIGTGLGRLLWEHAVNSAAMAGFEHLDMTPIQTQRAYT